MAEYLSCNIVHVNERKNSHILKWAFMLNSCMENVSYIFKAHHKQKSHSSSNQCSSMLEMLQNIFITENHGQYMENLLRNCYKSTDNK